MIRDGNYGQYQGIEYKVTRDMATKKVKIYTFESEKADKSFNSEILPNGKIYFEKYVSVSELSNVYRHYTYAVDKENKRMLVLKESEDQYLVTVGYNGMDLVEKYQLKEVDRGVFEGWISKAEVQLVEEKQHVQY